MALNSRAFNCGSCRCDSNHDAGFLKWRIPGVIETSTCLRWLVTQRSTALLAMYGHYRNGHLLTAGGIADQSNAYLEAMRTIDVHVRSRDATAE